MTVSSAWIMKIILSCKRDSGEEEHGRTSLFVGDAEDVDQCQDADNSPHSLETLNNAHVMTRGR